MSNSILNWQSDRLGNHIVRPEYGHTASASSIINDIKFLRITDLMDHGLNWDNVPGCICDEKILKKKTLVKGDLVIARIGATTGKSYLITNCPTAVFASYLIRIRTKKSLLPDYLYFVTKSSFYWKYIEANKGGKLKGGVNIPILENFEFLIPPLSEQNAITKILSSIQDAIEIRKKELELQRELKKALMAHLFTNGTKNEPLKQTEIGLAPQSWDIVKIGSCQALCVRTSFPTFAISTKENKLSEEEKIEVMGLKVSDMNLEGNNKYINNSQLFFSLPRSSVKKFLKPNSIIFPKRGAAIATNKKRISKYYSILDPNLIGIELNSQINHEYLFYFFENFNLEKLQDKSTIPQLNKHNVESMYIPLPPRDEQNEIAKILMQVDAKIDLISKETRLFEELFQAMLEELMTGRISSMPLIGNCEVSS